MRILTVDVFKRSWWRQVLLITCATFCFIHISGMLGTKLYAARKGWGVGVQWMPNLKVADSWEGRFARWDSEFYLQIAERGYQPDGDERGFFPLYAFVTSFVSNVSGLSLLWSGMLVSVACFAAASLFLYRWVLIDYEPQTARWAVIWFCVFPMSFFFVAFYAESLFLLTSIAALYFARRGQFVVSGLLIALAGATRPLAFLLAIPYVIEFWQQRNFNWRRCVEFGLGVLVAPLGTLSYLLFLAALSGNYNLITAYTSANTNRWPGYGFAWPWATWMDGIKAALFGVGIPSVLFSRLLAWQDLAYALLGLVLAIWALFRLRPSSALYLLAGILFLYTHRGPEGYAFGSISRHVAALFPTYLILALFTLNLRRPYRWLLLAASAGLLGILSLWFTSGRWVA